MGITGFPPTTAGFPEGSLLARGGPTMSRTWLCVLGLGTLMVVAGCTTYAPPPPAPAVYPPVASPPPVPPPQVEAQPPSPGPEYVWVPGHWAWRPAFGRYVWLPGHWVVPAERGLVWVPGHWVWGPRFGYHW